MWAWPSANLARLAAFTEDVVKTSEIEGEQLDVESARSYIARRLGVEGVHLTPPLRFLVWAQALTQSTIVLMIFT